MQAEIYGTRDSVACLGIAECQNAWGGPIPGLGLRGPAPSIQNVSSGEASSSLSTFVTTVASRLNIHVFDSILFELLVGALIAAYAYLIVYRADRKHPPTNYGNERFYQALIRNSQLPIAILCGGLTNPISFCGGAEILLECLSGPDAPEIARALNALLCKGTGFKTTLRGSDDRKLSVRGTPVGRFCAIYFSIGGFAEDRSAVQDAFNAIPVPMWVRRADRSIEWANKAFLSIPTLEKEETAENWEGSLATNVFNGAPVAAGRQFIVANGQRYVFQMDLAALSNGGLVGVATDMATMQSVETGLQRAAKVCAQAVEHAPFAMVIFDSNQRLVMHNKKFADLWELSEGWLKSGPSKGEIIDRLRDERKLPEQKHFQQWKRFQLLPSAGPDTKTTELWHLPRGRSLRIVTTSHTEGGQIIMLEDISEYLALEASLKRLSQVQKATIDALPDAIAIFGPDGCLTQHNPCFEELWQLAPSELSNKPHCSDIARLCDARIGRDEIWQVIAEAISAMVPATIIDIHETRRANGRLISLTLTRLPDGMTMALFSDFSDLSRFEAMLDEDSPIIRDSSSRLPQTG